MPFPPVRRRCKNCRKFFVASKENQVFHSVQCRRDFHNNGQTPEQQMLSRLQRFIKKPAFKTMLREVIQRELREMRKQTPTAQQAVITELNQTLATMR
jgi:hypothetical protein